MPLKDDQKSMKAPQKGQIKVNEYINFQGNSVIASNSQKQLMVTLQSTKDEKDGRNAQKI